MANRNIVIFIVFVVGVIVFVVGVIILKEYPNSEVAQIITAIGVMASILSFFLPGVKSLIGKPKSSKPTLTPQLSPAPSGTRTSSRPSPQLPTKAKNPLFTVVLILISVFVLSIIVGLLEPQTTSSGGVFVSFPTATVPVPAPMPISAMAWSPSGKYIAFGGADDTVQVWDAATRQKIYTYTGCKYGVRTVAWSPDSQRIACAGGSGTVQVWDATTGSHVITYTGHKNTVNAIAWSPSGLRIASGSGDYYFQPRDTTVQVWDVVDGATVYTYHGHFTPVQAVAWSPDGTRIASGEATDTVQVWDAFSGKFLFKLPR